MCGNDRSSPGWIQALYAPIQPVEYSGNGFFSHHHFYPGPALTPYIQSFWELKGHCSFSAPVSYPIVPDGSVDLIFSLLEEDPKGYISITGKSASELWLEVRSTSLGLGSIRVVFCTFFLSLSGILGVRR